uniref:CRAL-TRIO domain-containing protein n=1 Tax=Meloidogyne incognita TaxID=6306 RepID=A0A914MA31_MELIC
MSSSSIENLNNEEDKKFITQIRSHPKFVETKLDHSSSQTIKSVTDFDLLRWVYAYKGDFDLAILKFIRHLRIRKIIGLDFIENLNGSSGLDEMAEEYAPMEILGPVNDSDGRILLLERSGRFNLEQMVKSIRYSSFMLNRFRLMERIMKEIRLSEERTGKRQSAILLLDLDGMYFHTGLISFITGPYRIMWGTLVEQYPSFLSAIVCINCTPAMRTLWNACTPFLGDEYRQKVYLLGQENDWREKLPLLELSIPLEAFPRDYGGEREFKIREPKPYQTPILELSPKDLLELEELKIPAEM